MKFRQKLQVPFEFDVVFTRDLFASANETIVGTLPVDQDQRRFAVYVDRGLLDHFPSLLARIGDWFAAHRSKANLVAPPFIVPGGEAAKNDRDIVLGIIRQMQDLGLDRHAYVMAVGGGAVLDAVGLAVAVFHRGLRHIRVPTTVLSQSDSGVGVKNAINFAGVKNLIGTFAPPFAVINDAMFLTNLDQREWTSGLAESFKVGIIKDAPFIEELEALAPRLVARDLDAMERVVIRCAMLHLDHIRTGGDPFEFGAARPLDFGHWSAHKIESLTKNEVHHGEAVALGVALDLYIASRLGKISTAQRDRVCRAMEACGLVLWHPILESKDSQGVLSVLAGLEEFRQHLGGRLTLTLPDGLGRKREVNEMPPALVEEGIRWLRDRARAPVASR